MHKVRVITNAHYGYHISARLLPSQGIVLHCTPCMRSHPRREQLSNLSNKRPYNEAAPAGMAVIWLPCWRHHSIPDTMQQEEHSALSLSQQIGLSTCFGPQFLILTAAVLLTKLIQHDSPTSGELPRMFMPLSLILILIGFVVGVFLVVVAWTGLGKHTPEYWADIELSVMLLWSMLLEVSTNLYKRIMRLRST